MDDQQKRLAEELLFSEKKALSFAKHLYFGKFYSQAVSPFPVQSEEDQKAFDDLYAKVKIFVEQQIDPEWIDRHANIPTSVIAGLSHLGILGMSVPTEYGGLGMSQQAYCKVVELIAGKCASTALLINAHQSIGLRALLLFGTDSQKETWLKPLAQGKKIAAFSLTEANAGSDASGVETRAVYDATKKIYRLNGRKQWTTSGSLADVLTVMARTEVDTPQGKQDKITAFLVTPDMPGFKILAPSLEKVGMCGTKTANLEFTDMEVPADNVLGPIGSGLKVCLTVLDYGRTTFGAMCTGAAKFLVDSSIQHAKNRYQFKRPIGSFGLVKKKISRMAALAYAMEASTLLTAGMIDHGTEDIMLESAILKVFASEALWLILYDSMQIQGGRSFFKDQPFERMMRDARLNMIGEGSNEVLKAFIGAVGMRDVGMQLKSFLDALKHPINHFDILKLILPNLFGRCFSPHIHFKSNQLNCEAKQLAKGIHHFGIAIIRLLKRYRENIVEKQLDLERIADSAIAIFTATAVLSKLDSVLSGLIPQTSNEELSIGKLYCRMAFSTIKKNLDNLFCTEDTHIEALSDHLTGIKFP